MNAERVKMSPCAWERPQYDDRLPASINQLGACGGHGGDWVETAHAAPRVLPLLAMRLPHQPRSTQGPVQRPQPPMPR
jgi:hypothetical protein